MNANIGLSDRIRQRAVEKYVKPALRHGTKRFSIRIKELMQDLETDGFPRNHPAQFCTALRKRAFLQEHGLVIESEDGPKSGTSTTVVLHLKVAEESVPDAVTVVPAQTPSLSMVETPEAKAKRVIEGLRGLLADEIASFGGAEAFMRWVRSEDEDDK